MDLRPRIVQRCGKLTRPRLAAIESLHNKAITNQLLINHSTIMTNATIGLMRAMNPQR